MPETPPFDARAVANQLLDLADGDGLPISHLALQKLLWFAHGQFLIETGMPLMRGAFEAWSNGPVHPAVYHAFKSAGREPITVRAIGRNIMLGTSVPLPAPQDARVAHYLTRILGAYGKLSPFVLVQLSHARNGPWHVVRMQHEQGVALGARISDQITKDLFRYQKLDVNSLSDSDLEHTEGEPPYDLVPFR